MSCRGFVVATKNTCPTKPKICTSGPFQRRRANPSSPSHLDPSIIFQEAASSCDPHVGLGMNKSLIPSGIQPSKNTNLTRGNWGGRAWDYRDQCWKSDQKEIMRQTEKNSQCCSCCSSGPLLPMRIPNPLGAGAVVVGRHQLAPAPRSNCLWLVPSALCSDITLVV